MVGDLDATLDAVRACGDDAAGEVLGRLRDLCVGERRSVAPGDSVDEACATIERLLGASDVAMISGLRWS